METKLKNLFKRIDMAVDQLIYSQSPKEVSPFFPSHIHIEPTNACNLHCVHCHHHNGSRQSGLFTRQIGMMRLKTYNKAIDEISRLSSAISLDNQGEPLLHKDILHMISYAKIKGLNVSLLTNATMLVHQLAEHLIDLHLDRIVFSFDAINKQLYESLRIGADFETTLNNIKHFVNLNEKKGHRTYVCISIIVHSKTKEHLADFKTYWSQYPIDTVFESPLLNLSGGSGLSYECFGKSKDIIINSDELPICRVPWENMVINWDGLVTVCPLDYDCKFPVGSIEDSDLMTIWNNHNYKIFRASNLNRDYALIEKKGRLCSACNCLFDEEYDLRNYEKFFKNNFKRLVMQYLSQKN